MVGPITNVPRTQHDGKQNEYSLMTALHFDKSEDKTRQEDAADTDLNTMLRKFGINIPTRQVTYGEHDFNVDLQAAITSINQAREMHEKLPANLREKYPTWQHVLSSIESGELVIDFRSEAAIDEAERKEAERRQRVEKHQLEEARRIVAAAGDLTRVKPGETPTVP